MEGNRIGMLGAGNMASALVRGLLASATLRPEQLRASDVRAEPLRRLEQEHGIVTHSDNRELVTWANVVVLAVKPQGITAALDSVADELSSEKLLISVAAGVPIDSLQARLRGPSRIIRVMPNTPALVLAGATALAAGAHATPGDLSLAVSLFDAVGRTAVVSESLMDVATGLSGSGPAYVMIALEALADGAVRMGMPRDTALLLAAQTLLGAAKLQLDTGEHPAVLKDRVTSPGGTTAAGLQALETGGLRAALINAVVAATERGRELGALAKGK